MPTLAEQALVDRRAAPPTVTRARTMAEQAAAERAATAQAREPASVSAVQHEPEPVEKQTQADTAAPAPVPSVQGQPVAVDTPLGRMTLPRRGTQAEEQATLLNRSGHSAARDIIASPAAFGILPAAAAAGFEKLIGTVDTFGEGMLSDEGQALHQRSLDMTLSEAERNASANELAHGGSEYLRPGASWGMDLYSWASDKAGVYRDPATGLEPMDQEIGGTLLSSAVTLPLLPLKAVTLGGKGATLAARTAIKAAELSTPLTIVQRGSTPASMATQATLNAVVGTGIDQATRAMAGEPHLFSRTPQPVDSEGMPGYGGEVVGTGVAVAAAGGASLGLAAAVRPQRAAAIMKAAARGNVPTTPPPGAVPAGGGRLGSLQATNPLQAYKTGVGWLSDDKAIIKQAIDRVGATTGEDVDNAVRTLSGASLTEQVRRVYDYGDYGKGVRGPSITGWKGKVGALSQPQLAKARMAVEAGNELRKRREGLPPSLTQYDDAALQRRWQHGMADPELRPILDEHRDIYRAVADMRYKKGLTDAAQHQRELSAGTFMHSAEVRQPGSIVEKAVQPLRQARAFLSGKPIKTAGVQPRGGMTAMVPFDEIIDDYVTHQLRHAAHESAKGMVLKTLAGRAQVSGSRNVIVKKWGKGQDVEGGKVVSVMEDGKRAQYVVGDKRLVTALEFRPRASVPGATEMKRAMQWGTTGTGNPLYAPISAINDLGANVLGMRSRYQVSGLIDEHMKYALDAAGMPEHLSRFVRQLAAGPVRLTEILPNFVEGFGVGVRGRWLMHAADHAKKLADASGNPMDAQRADAAIRAYYESRFGRMQATGYAPNAFVVDYETAQHAMTNAAMGASNGVVRKSYKHGLEVIREAFRMAAFSRNYAHAQATLGRPPNAKEVRRITGHVRNLGGDITKQGEAQWLNGLVSTIPYGNTILQSGVHLVEHMFTNPAAWSVIATVVAMRSITKASLSPEAREYIDTQVPEYTRNDTLYLEQERAEGEAFDPTKHLEAVPLTPELGSATTLASMFFEAMMTHAGLLEPAELPPGSSTVGQRSFAVLADLVGFGTPPIVNFALAAFNKGPLDISAGIMQDREVLRQGRPDTAHVDQRGYDLDDGVVSDRLAGMLTASLGTMGRMITDGAETLFDHKAQDKQGRQTSDALSPKAWRDAMDVTLFNTVEQQQVGQWLTDASKVLPRSTPLANEAYRVNNALEEAADLSRGLVAEIDGVTDADLYSGRAFQVMSEKLTKPELARQAVYLHQYMLSPQHQMDMEAIGDLKVRIHRIRGSTDAPVHAKNKQLNALNAEVQDRFQRVLYNYGKLTERMTQFDPEWTIESFMTAAREDLEG